MKIIILLGMPGSGKGTCANFLHNEYGFSLVSVGDILRSESKGSSEEAKNIKNSIDNGLLINDSLMQKIITKKILSLSQSSGIVLDGFPRNINQVKIFEKIKLHDLNSDYELISLYLYINKELALKRLLNRIICNFCGFIYNGNNLPELCINCNEKDFIIKREDDMDKNVVLKRLKHYNNEGLLVVDYYRNKQNFCFIEIDADNKIDDIKNEIKNYLAGDKL